MEDFTNSRMVRKYLAYRVGFTNQEPTLVAGPGVVILPRLEARGLPTTSSSYPR